MTLEQIRSSLPNGFHDAQIVKMSQDFAGGTLTLLLKILVGLPDQGLSERNVYRLGNLGFRSVQFCAVEYPDAESPFQDEGPLWFSIDCSDPHAIPVSVNLELPSETQRCSLFIRNWYSNIHIAALDLSFDWLD